MQSAVEENPSATKERLLDVAARLFAERGFDAVSLRTLTTEAEVNLAAVNYHFGSKDALIGAVIARQLQPVNQARLDLLAALPRPLKSEGIVAAFVDPVFEAVQAGGGSDGHFCRLMARCMAQRDERISETLVEQFREVVACFVAAMMESAPSLDEATAHLRLLFMGGTLGQTLFHFDLIEKVSSGTCSAPDFDQLRDEMVAFLAAGNTSVAPKPKADA